MAMLESPSRHDDPDAPIRATDNDAAIARLSAVRKGYLTDPYITALVPRAHLQQPRPPLINIGTYLRARGIDDLLENWFRSAGGHRVQIVSLGAGSDTRFWRLAVRTVLWVIQKAKERKRRERGLILLARMAHMRGSYRSTSKSTSPRTRRARQCRFEKAGC